MMGRTSQKNSEMPIDDGSVTLPELRDRLVWFDVDVTPEALRQALGVLGVEPLRRGLARSGRGRSSYYHITVLWLLAAAYHRAYRPSGTLAGVRKKLDEAVDSTKAPEPLVWHFYNEGPYVPKTDTDRQHAAYMGIATDLENGLDLRLVERAARLHWTEVGLDDEKICGTLTNYMRRTLEMLGVPANVTKDMELTGR